MIRSIVFDWGGVLIKNPSLEMLGFFAKTLQVPSKEFLKVYKGFISDFQKGLLSEEPLWETVCEELGYEKPRCPSLWEAAFQSAYVENKELFKSASILKKEGYRIGVLSNTETPAVRFFKKRQYTLFDVTVFSCEEHAIKPERQIYEILLNRLGMQPEEVLFVDDKEEFVEGARQVGINAVLYQNERQFQRACQLLL
jgi:epoxide hydrolase-like predicted phosphatase